MYNIFRHTLGTQRRIYIEQTFVERHALRIHLQGEKFSPPFPTKVDTHSLTRSPHFEEMEQTEKSTKVIVLL